LIVPELPEVATFRKHFEKHAIGQKIASVQLKDSRITRWLQTGELERELAGREFISTRQHGKYLFAETGGGKWLVMHFGMTGYLQYFEKPEEDPKYDRMLIRFERRGFLSYVNQRMLGWIGLTANPDDLIEQKGLGLSALDPRLDYVEFQRIFSRLKGEIKPALMNQRLIAGIGNLYADEILFQAGIHPKMKAGFSEISEKELKSIFVSIGEVLRTAIDKNADFGRLPQEYLLPNRRKGAKCPVCENKLQTAKVGGRTSYFCPKCQKARH
jgi:formamidopyrimidine-DNA glycosylase